MDDLIVKLCEDRRSWLFVTAGTLGLCLVFVLPCVDEYLAVCAEIHDLKEELERADESAAALAGFEQRRVEQIVEVDQQLDKTLNEDNEAEYRNSMVRMVRSSGCQLRRLHIGSPIVRDWGHGDSPLDARSKKKLTPTGFRLERRQVNLVLVGPSANVRKLMNSIESEDKLLHVQALELKPSSGNGRGVELGMELWYFTLNRPAA